MPNPTNITVTSRATAVPLLSTETVVFKSRKSLWLMIVPLFFIIAVVVLLVFALQIQLVGFNSQLKMYLYIGIAVVTFFITTIIVLDWLSTIYTLTNRRVQWRFGIIGEQTKTIALNQITNTKLTIGIFGRIFNYGNITIEAANINSTIIFKGISSAKIKKDQIDTTLN